jgi:hypothetical protein
VADGLNNYVKGHFGLHVPNNLTVWFEAFDESSLIDHRHSARMFTVEFDYYVMKFGRE